MPKLPTVAIIGKPNTGKSTLFNRLIGRRKAIVSEIAGTTRDHVASVVEGAEIPYLLVDTGGMGGGTEDKAFEEDVHAQSLLAIEHADVILFTVNSREELTKNDREIVAILRKRRRSHVPVLLVVTKCDNPEKTDDLLPEYHELGIAEGIFGVSATHGLGIEELEEGIAEELKKMNFKKEEEGTEPDENALPRIAIVGQPNVGKSSFINALMADPDRDASPRLVSEISGTTRDATDTVIRREGKEFIFIDTAGLRKAATKADEIEGLSILRTVQALEHADVILLVTDAGKPTSKQDKRIAALAIDSGKGLIVAVNKADLLSPEQKAEKKEEIASALQFAKFAPLLFCSAKTREGLPKVFGMIEAVSKSRIRRIPTKALNDWFGGVASSGPVGQVGKSKHITQASDVPPTFVLFVRDPKKVQIAHLKFLERKLREVFGFEGTPIRFVTKGPKER